MVRVRLVDEQDPPGARGDRAQAARPVLDDARVAAAVGVVHVEAAVLRVVGVEGQPEQPLLAPRDDAAADVEEEAGAQPAALDHPDRAALLDDVETWVALRRGDRHRRVQPAHEGDEARGRPFGGSEPAAPATTKRESGEGERAHAFTLPKRSKVRAPMRIFVIGAGQVGSTVVEALHVEHELSVSTSTPPGSTRSATATTSPLEGNGTSTAHAQGGRIETADLLIAVHLARRGEPGVGDVLQDALAPASRR